MRNEKAERVQRRAPRACEHLIGTAVTRFMDHRILVYVTDWRKIRAYEVGDRFRFCPKCGRRVNAKC
jgi:hypothetical protein